MVGIRLKISTAAGYSLYFTTGLEMSPRNCSFPWGSGPHLIYGSLGPPDSMTQTVPRSVQPCLHSTWLCPTDRHRPRNIGNNRPRLCTRCGFVIRYILALWQPIKDCQCQRQSLLCVILKILHVYSIQSTDFSLFLQMFAFPLKLFLAGLLSSVLK